MTRIVPAVPLEPKLAAAIAVMDQPSLGLPCLYTRFSHQAPGLVAADIVCGASQFSDHAAAAIAATLLAIIDHPGPGS